MEEKTLQAVLVSNTVVMAVFIFQKVIEYLFLSHTKNKDKQEHTIDELNDKISQVQADIAALKAQVEITLNHVFKIQKVERDVHALAEKLRQLK